MGVREVFSRYSVSIAIVSIVAAGHYGWLKLQDVKALVSPEEKKDLPFYTLGKVIYEYAKGMTNAKQE